MQQGRTIVCRFNRHKRTPQYCIVQPYEAKCTRRLPHANTTKWRPFLHSFACKSSKSLLFSTNKVHLWGLVVTSSCIRFIDYFMSPISLFLDRDGCFFWNEISFATSSRRDDSKVYFYWSRFLFCTPTSLTLLATTSFYPKCRQGRKGICPPTADILF